MRTLLLLAAGVVLLGCQSPQPTPPTPATSGWGWKLATTPDDAMNFLNGAGSYQDPVSEARICLIQKATHSEFYVFYRKAAASERVDSWGWKLATTIDDAHDFVNGQGAYTRAVKSFEIAATGEGSQARFYIFYARER
jgi:hypothetical protein